MLYPIGIQSFSEIREGGFVYVDKTRFIYELASTGKYYFLSRPRRFGKSLLLSTMEAYFRGRKVLFKGLAMEKLEKDWTPYPVLHLDLTGSRYLYLNDLKEKLASHLNRWEKEYGKTTEFTDPASRFDAIIDAAYRRTGSKVVILIDEYEKPIIDNMDNPELMGQFQRELQGFYSVLKGKDDCIRFAFLTGVTKLGKMSIFSGLNNLNDISMNLRYSDICGVSESELHGYFDGSVGELASSCGMSKEKCYAKLARMYDGYHFCEDSQGVYNPFSLLNTFSSRRFRMYLFETGKEHISIVQTLKREGYNLNNISECRVSEFVLDGVVATPIMLMYQTGYLTIKSYDERFNAYTLDYPNEEVKSGFLNSLSQLYAPSLIKDSVKSSWAQA